MADHENKPQSGDYEVGYGKPPKHTRFQKGQRSANPKGRPRKSSSLAAIARAEAEEPVPITSPDGKRRKISTVRAMVRQMKVEALKGDRTARKEFLKLQLDVAAGAGMTPEDLLRQSDEEARRKEKAAELSASIIALLEFTARGKKSGLMDFRNKVPHFTRLAGKVADFLETLDEAPADAERARAEFIAAIDAEAAARKQRPWPAGGEKA